MNATIHDSCRRKLEKLRDRLVQDVRQIESEELRDSANAEDAGVPGDRTDVSLEAAKEEVNLALLGNEEHLLEEVTAALERLQRGHFGHCDRCRQMISSERLRSVPYARLCITCAGAESVVPPR